MREVFHEVADLEVANLLGSDGSVVVATMVRTKGSTPQKPGTKLLVQEDGSGVGTRGSGTGR